MKKLVSVLLAAVMLILPVIGSSAADSGSDTDFTPVIRFALCSDTHIKDDSDVNAERIGMLMDIAYAEAEKDPSYNKLDALLIAGDLTNDGRKSEFDKFWRAVSGSIRGDTRFLGVVAKSHDGWDLPRQEMLNYYETLSGNKADFHEVINGYHFIGVSVSPKEAFRYDFDQMAWLKKQLDAAVADDPNKPVFVMQHEHLLDTVYGSSIYDGWGQPELNGIIGMYPQAVDVSGHSHYPLNDPRSIWQGLYTAIGTGAIYYAEFTIDEMRAYDPPDCQEAATFWLVELDAASTMHLRGFDVNENKMLCEYYIDNPADITNRDYTNAAKRARAKAPEFAEGTEIKTEVSYGKCEVTVPKAESTDGMPIVLYRAYAKNRLGITIAETWTLPYYYRAIEQDEISFTLEGLGNEPYTISVVAENAFGMKSAPVKTTIQGEGGNAFETLINRIVAKITHFIDYIKGLFD